MYTSLACGMNAPREYILHQLNNNACKYTEKQNLLLVSGFTFTIYYPQFCTTSEGRAQPQALNAQ